MNETPLPAFLRRRNGRLELVLHCTWVQDFDVCAEKFWLRYGVQVEGTGAKAALNYGAAVHEALKLRYANQSLALSKVEEVQLNVLSTWFDANPNPGDDYRNATRAQDLIRAYNAEYPAHEWEVLAVEEEFEVEVGEVPAHTDTTGILRGIGAHVPTVPVYLAGRKDLVVSWHGGLWVVDHKTASQWGGGDSNSALDEGRMSFQFRGYAWAERETQCERSRNAPSGGSRQIDGALARATLPILGTVGNYLVSRKPYASEPKPGRASTPRNHFHQECYPYAPEALDEWRDECLAKAALILQRHAASDWHLHRNRGSCGHWGRCEFYDYCEAAPGERAGLLASSLYQPKLIEHNEL